jgi:hypothetical protein
METKAFLFIALGFVLLTLVCVLTVVWAVSVVSKSLQTGFYVGAILGIWLGFTAILAWSGFTRNFDMFPLNLGVLLLPPILALVMLTFNKKFSLFLQKVPLTWLIWMQFFRVMVEVLLWQLYENDLMPIQMSFEGRNFDILVGLTAPFFAYFFAKNAKVLFWWNIAGLLLLANIVITAILSMPTPLRMFMNEPSNTIVTYFPILWLPAFLVPLAYYMHLLALKKIAFKG